MAQMIISIKADWRSEQTDCSECDSCEDMIVSEMWRLWTVIDIPKADDSPTDIVICDSCKRAIKDEV